MAISINGSAVIDDSRKLVNYRLTTSEINTNTTAVTGTSYVALAAITLTLPASPTVGDIVGFQNSSGTTGCIIGRNGSNIMSLAENMTVNRLHCSFNLVYTGATRGWVFA